MSCAPSPQPLWPRPSVQSVNTLHTPAKPGRRSTQTCATIVKLKFMMPGVRRMPERHEIEAFLTLAEELHFGRTAERLRVSTTRISQTIRKLERGIGAPLFDRTSRRVELSPLGRQLYDQIQPAWAQIGAAYSRAVNEGRGRSGTVRVA